MAFHLFPDRPHEFRLVAEGGAEVAAALGAVAVAAGILGADLFAFSGARAGRMIPRAVLPGDCGLFCAGFLRPAGHHAAPLQNVPSPVFGRGD